MQKRKFQDHDFERLILVTNNVMVRMGYENMTVCNLLKKIFKEAPMDEIASLQLQYITVFTLSKRN